MKKCFTYIASAFILLSVISSCSSTPVDQTPNSLLPTQTVMILPTLTSLTAPVLPKPAQSPNLLPVNNAAEVWENNTWVVKNSEGKITAVWADATQSWTYDYRTIQIIFWGATKPNTALGIDSVHLPFVVPSSWEIPLRENEMDPDPLVPSGVINNFQTYSYNYDTREGLYTYVEFGVDYRGIVLAESAGTALNGGSTIKGNTYVAGFSFIDPNHPDLMYLITMPIYDSENGSTWIDLNPNVALHGNSDFVRADKDDPDLYTVLNPKEVIQVLSDPSVIGRRMVIGLKIPIDGQLYSDPAIVQQNKLFYDSVIAGSPIANIETSAHVEWFRLPKDLDFHVTE